MTHTLTLPSICRSVTYILWSSDFSSYLEDYLMEKCCTWDNGSLLLKDRPRKIYVGQWPIFHGPLILPYIIVRLKLFLYIKKWHRPGLFVSLWALALVFQIFFFFFFRVALYPFFGMVHTSCFIVGLFIRKKKSISSLKIPNLSKITCLGG